MLFDIGTGSGAIALALKSKRGAWDVCATDISADALTIARQNAEKTGLAVTFEQGDLLAALTGIYDIIVANLPYVAELENHFVIQRLNSSLILHYLPIMKAWP